MMIKPKGYNYWKRDDKGVSFVPDDAPIWVKQEFEEYKNELSVLEDEDGNVTNY